MTRLFSVTAPAELQEEFLVVSGRITLWKRECENFIEQLPRSFFLIKTIREIVDTINRILGHLHWWLCTGTCHSSWHTPGEYPACPPQSGRPWYGPGLCLWCQLPKQMHTYSMLISIKYTIKRNCKTKKQTKMPVSYPHGLVKSLRKVTRCVFNALDWNTKNT